MKRVAVNYMSYLLTKHSQPVSHPACEPELYRLQSSTLHKCNVDQKGSELLLNEVSVINQIIFSQNQPSHQVRLEKVTKYNYCNNYKIYFVLDCLRRLCLVQIYECYYAPLAFDIWIKDMQMP